MHGLHVLFERSVVTPKYLCLSRRRVFVNLELFYWSVLFLSVIGRVCYFHASFHDIVREILQCSAEPNVNYGPSTTILCACRNKTYRYNETEMVTNHSYPYLTSISYRVLTHRKLWPRQVRCKQSPCCGSGHWTDIPQV